MIRLKPKGRQVPDHLIAFKNILLLLKKSGYHKRPWHLILGPRGTGKKTLAHALSDSESQQNPAYICQGLSWQLTANELFLIVDSDEGNLQPETVVDLFKLHHCPTNHFLIVESLDRLMKKQLDSGLEPWIEVLSGYVDDGHRSLTGKGKNPIICHYLLTKLDQIAGFNEYSQLLDRTTSQSPLGIDFGDATHHGNETFQYHFHHSFGDLIERLNGSMLVKLHREHSLAKRSLMEDFPRQISQLEDRLLEQVMTIKQRMESPLLSFAGCYFTSLMQTGLTKQILLNQTRQFETKTMSTTSSKGTRPYFLTGLAGQVFAPRATLCYEQSQEKRLSPAAIRGSVAGTVFLIATGLFWQMTGNLRDQGLALYQTGHLVTAYQLNHQTSLSNSQAALEQSLRDVKLLEDTKQLWHHAEHNQHVSIKGKEKLHSPSFKKLTQSNYQLALTKELLPTLSLLSAEQLTKQLKKSDLLDAYQTLGVYLMLHQAANWDKLSFERWMTKYYLTYSPKGYQSLSLLKRYLHQIGEEKINDDSSMDWELVHHARQQIRSLPLDQRAQLLVKQMLYRHPADPILLSLQKTQIIPGWYSRNFYKNVFSRQINQLATELRGGSWIVGKISEPISAAAAVAAIKSAYFNLYLTHWTDAIANMKTFDSRNLGETILLLDRFSDPKQSPITQTVPELIKHLTVLPRDRELAAVLNELSDIKQKELDSYLEATSQLSKALKTIVQSDNSEELAYGMARDLFTGKAPANVYKHYEHLVKRAPPLVAQWLTDLEKQSQTQLLTLTTEYIDRCWVTDVHSYYQRFLQDRYPVNRESNEDVGLSHWTAFFAPDGHLNQFVHLIEPFVDMNQTPWKARAYRGQTLPMDRHALLKLAHAKLISDVFFNENQQVMNIPFSMQSIAIAPHVKRLNLDIEGHKLLITQKHRGYKDDLHWPVSSKMAYSSMDFESMSGAHALLSTSGPWALFRLLDRSLVESSNDPRLFKITFDLNGKSAKYQLLASSPLNPFIPGLIHDLDLPEALFKGIG